MIDAVEVTVALLKMSSALLAQTGGRIAGRHEYGGAWSIGDAGLIAHLDSGEEDAYTETYHARMELRFYEDSPAAALNLYQAAAAYLRSVERVAVSTSAGDVLVYSALPTSGVSLLRDDSLGMDLAAGFWTISIGY